MTDGRFLQLPGTRGTHWGSADQSMYTIGVVKEEYLVLTLG